MTVGLPYLVLATTSPLAAGLVQPASRGRVAVPSVHRLERGIGAGVVELPVPRRAVAGLAGAGMGMDCGIRSLRVMAVYCAIDAGKDRGRAVGDVGARAAEDAGPPPGVEDQVMWWDLPALACALFLAVTNQICQEVAAIPSFDSAAHAVLAFAHHLFLQRASLRPLFLPPGHDRCHRRDTRDHPARRLPEPTASRSACTPWLSSFAAWFATASWLR